jgi:hypothetical protein
MAGSITDDLSQIIALFQHLRQCYGRADGGGSCVAALRNSGITGSREMVG